jgi:hypothetical protein
MRGGHSRNNKWTEQQVGEILHNPIYVGMGPFPPLIDEATWIACQEQLFRTEGVQPALKHMRQVLTTTLGMTPACLADPDWPERAAAEIARRSASTYFRELFGSLRKELDGPPE